jgi:lipopolysaccharide/colanic/teichoic acid biosynthesis glycosyltransferase
MLAAEFREFRKPHAPGLTGIWQVMVMSDGTKSDQERFDSYYIRNWSLWMDLYLIARTIFTVLGGKGAR